MGYRLHVWKLSQNEHSNLHALHVDAKLKKE